MNTLKTLGRAVLSAAVIYFSTIGQLYSQCTVNAGPDVTKCLGQPYNPGPAVSTSGTTGAVTYSWNGTTFSASPATGLAPTVTTTYTLTIQDASGCTATDQFTLTVLPLPTVNAGSDFSLCPGTPTALCATASSPNGVITLYTWTSGPSTQCYNIAPTTQTTYTVTAVDVAGCQKSDPITVFMFPAPNVDAGSNQSICLSQGSVQLTGSPAGGSWTGSGVNASGLFTATTTGAFTLTYTYSTSNGCTNSDQVTVTVTSPTPISAGSDQEFCLNDSDYQLPQIGTWSGSSFVTSSGMFSPDAAGTYNLTVTAGASGCTVSDQLQVVVHDLPNANAGNNASICSAGSVQLNGSASSPNGSITNISWTGSGLNNSGILNPTASPANTTNYTLSVTDNEGCQASDQVMVTVNTYPAVDAGNNITFCSNAGAQSLTGFSPSGGTWSGTGVSTAGIFTPTVNGNFSLTYSYSSNGCTSTDQITVTVVNPGSLDAGANQSVCLLSSPIQLLSGGTWSGSPFVTSAGLFSPGVVGNYTLTYTAMSGGCLASDQIEIEVLPLPTVNAGADDSACPGATIQLNGSASSPNGAITSIFWNSSLLSDQNILNPTMVLNADITHTLQITDIAGCSSADHVTWSLDPLPTVNAGSDITFCNQPIPQQLTGFSPAGGIWSGTGVSSSGVFTPSGTGTTTLTYCFTNAFGCSSCDNIEVTVNNPVVANAGADVSICAGSSSVLLQPVTPGGTWTSSTFLSSSGVFTPTTPGIYNCTYTLGSGSCLNSDIRVVTVNSLPTVDAGDNASVCGGTTYQLEGTATGSGQITYSWNNAALLDNAGIANPLATASTDTNFTLTVTDGNGCSASDQMQLDIVEMPVADFSSPAVVCLNAPVTFDNFSSNAVSYQWSLGNSSSSVNAEPTTTYGLTGTYTIQLIATNSIGCQHTVTGSIDVISAPVADFTISANVGCSPLQVDFENLTTGSNFTSTWDLGATSYVGVTPPATLFTANNVTTDHEIILTSSNICGSDTQTHTVAVDPQPTAGFTTSLSSSCSPVTTTFSNTSTGNPQYFHWEFGDGDISDAPVPGPKIYTTDDDSEDFTITLTAYNACGSDSESAQLTVLPNSIHINLQPTVTVGCSPLFVEFNNQTTGASNFYFDFGDDDSSGLMSPNHIFNDADVYTVIMYANDGCSYDTTSVDITVMQSPTITTSVEEPASCPLTDIHFHSSTTGNITDVIWDFGTGLPVNNTDPVYQYPVGDFYSINATAADINGCMATSSFVYEVYPKPVASMELSTSNGCSPMTVCTNNTSTGATGYQWNFMNGDGSTDFNDCTNYSNSSGQPQEYTVILHVSNEYGCTDITMENLTVLHQPSIEASLNDTESCTPMLPVNVTVTSDGAQNFEWYVDGSMVSDEALPVLSFEEEGTHDVHVLAINEVGCTDVAYMNYTVHPLPQIDIMPDVFNGCAPLSVGFENQTTNGELWTWTFSNGSHSNVSEPQIQFADPGKYDVQLQVISAHGCQQVEFFEDMIEVFPVPVANFLISPDDPVIYKMDIEFTNLSEGATDYYWNFGDGFASREIDPIHYYQTGGYFNVNLRAQNEYGCSSEMTKPVRIDNTFHMFMPNSFTPDNDGLNDVFMPVFSSIVEIESYEFVVLNKWGQVVFKTEDPENGWTGNTGDGQYYVHNDNFSWMVHITFNNQQVGKDYQGSVTVLR